MSYTKEHIDILVEAMNIRFGNNWSFDANKLNTLLNKIFVIKKTKARIKVIVGPPKNYIFYNNTLSLGGPKNNKLRIYTIKSIVSIESVKKELKRIIYG